MTILCKAVDNFGDVGFALRLARSISRARPSARVRIVCDNAALFRAMAGGERVRWNLFQWDGSDGAAAEFSARPPSVILQCFQCGYPAWLEALLFGEGSALKAFVVNIDYLTAESFAEDFHLLKSLTRSARVQKINFMPGFTRKTGGLLLDGARKKIAREKGVWRALMFGYARDFKSVVDALSAFSRKSEKKTKVFVARGQGEKPFVDAWRAAGSPFALEVLPFMAQTEWDDFLLGMDFLFVRGEDSLSRACLSGIPFLWQAYPQKDGHQKVKVAALLARMENFFPPEDFRRLRALAMEYNESAREVESAALLRFLEGAENSRPSFGSFARALRENGDAAEALLRCVDSMAAPRVPKS